MATSQIQASAALGKFLQRVYSDGITNQISEDFRDWEMVNKLKVSDQAARTVDFLINKSYGARAVQWKGSGFSETIEKDEELKKAIEDLEASE